MTPVATESAAALDVWPTISRSDQAMQPFHAMIRPWLASGFGLPAFEQFHTEPGMEFGGMQQWWVRNAPLRRPAPHMGVDLLWYKGGSVISEMGGSSYPMICSGTVAAIFPDILGSTFLIRTDFTAAGNQVLYVAYAHSNATINKAVGDDVIQGETWLAVAQSRTSCPSHLHISTFWAKPSFDIAKFDWNTTHADPTLEMVNPLPDDISFAEFVHPLPIEKLQRIGERLNYGFTKTKELLDLEDLDALVQIARNQVANGAAYLAINIGNDALAREHFLRRHIQTIQDAVSVPLAFDGTDTQVLRICLETYDAAKAAGQKPILNSVSEGRMQIVELLSLKPSKIVIMASEREENGVSKMNETPQQVYDTVRRIVPKLVEKGLTMDDIYVDVAIGPIAADLNGRTRTVLGAIALLGSDPELRGIHIMVGLTNFSQGLPTLKHAGFSIRSLMESAFLTRAMPLGLDTILATPTTNFSILPEGHFVLKGFDAAVAATDGMEALIAVQQTYMVCE